MRRDLESHAVEVLGHALAPLADLFDDPEVQEVMVNRPDSVWFERKGVLDTHPVALADAPLRTAVHVIAALCDKEVGERGRAAILDARLHGLRIAAALPPVAVHGIALCVRKHVRRDMPLDRFDHAGSVRADRTGRAHLRPVPAIPERSPFELLRSAIAARRNLLVSGSTASGKTTLLNALLAEIPPHERIVTIEDTAELFVRAPNHVSFESNQDEGVGLRDLVRLALRFRPDRIVVGEVRGGEAFDLLQALSTGHDGGLATVHASGALAALARLEQLVLQSGIGWPFEAIRRQIAGTIDYVVHLTRRDGVRSIAQVLEVRGVKADGYDAVPVFGAIG